MTTLRTIDTRLFILATLVIVIMAQGFSTWVEVRDDIGRQELRIKRDLRRTLDLLAPVLAQYVRVGDIQSMQAAMMVLAADPEVDLAAAIARDGRILAANEVALIGLPAAELPRIGAAVAGGAPSRDADLRNGPDGTIILRYPLQAIAGEAVDAAPRPYVVVMHDIGLSSAVIRNAAWHEAMVTGAVAALIALALSLVFARYISNPTRKLAAAVRDFGVTGAVTSLEMRGSGDLADLGVAFARAGERLVERQSALTRMNEELLRRREYLEVTLRSIGDGVIVTDALARVTAMNAAAEKLTDWREAFAIGQPLASVLALVHAATGEAVALSPATLLQSGGVIDLGQDALLRAPDGRQHRIAASAAPIFLPAGEAQGAILIFRDVGNEYALRNALEVSERRLRAAIDSGAVGIWEWDARTDQFVHFGIWLDQFSELASSGAFLGADHMRITHPDDREPVRAALLAHLKGDSDTYQVEQRFLMRDGKYRRFLVRGIATERNDAGRAHKLTGTYTDITELREQQHRLELALEFGREGLFEWLPTTDDLRLSDNWLSLFGTPANRLRNLRTDFSVLLHPADAVTAGAALVRALKGPEPYETEFRVRRNDGAEMWVLARGVVTDRDVNGRALRMLGVQVDINDLKLAQDRLQLAVDSVPQGIIEWWPEDDRVLPGESWLRLTGYAPEDVRTPAQMIERRMFHPDDAKAVQKLLIEFSSGLIVSGKREFRFRFASGEYHWILASGQVAEYDAEGRSRRIVGTFIDISGLKSAEQRLEVAVEAARQGIWEWLPETDQFIASRSWMRLFGYAAEEMPTMAAMMTAVVHPDDVLAAGRILREMWRDRREHGEMEVRMRKQNGDYLTVLARAVVADRDGAGRATRIVGTDFDITELKRAHTRLDLALRSSLQGMFEWRPPDDELILDPSWNELTGFALRELPTKMHPTAKLLVHPDDFGRVWKVLDDVRNKGVDEILIEYRQRNRAGDYIWVMTRGLVVERDEAGRALRLMGSNLDISHLKQAEERTQLAVEATGLGLWEWLPQEDRLQFPGDSWWRLSGYQPGQFTTMEEMIALQHPADRPRMARHLGAMIAGEIERAELTLRLKHADGRYVFLLTRGFVAERDTRGNPLRIAGTSVDITALKEAEQELESSRQLLRTVLDTAPDGIFWKDTRGVYLGANRQLAIDAGYDTSAQVIGRTDYDMPWSDLAETMRTSDVRLFSGEIQRLSAERRLKLPDGRARWVHTTKVPLYDGGGEVMGTLGVVHDITAYKLALADLEAEHAALELVIYGTGAGIWDWNVATGDARLNERWAQMLGYDSLAELGPMTHSRWQSLVHPDDLPGALAQLHDVIEGGRELYECDFRIRHRDGHWIWSHDTGRVTARDGNDRPIRLSGTFIDITERVERDRHLKTIAEAVTRARSGDLLNTVVRTARELADASHAFVAALDESGKRLTIIATAPADSALDGLSYEVEGTPSFTVMHEGTCVYPQAVTDHFPATPLLRQLGAVSYAGQRLDDEAGAPAGIFALLSTEPLGAVERTLSVLHILAATAANELERERRNVALRDSEMRYRRIYEIMPILLCTLDGQANILDVNEAWVQVSGYSLHKCVGQPITRFFAPASRDHLTAMLEQGRKLIRGEREYLDLVDRHGNLIKTAFTLFGSGRIAATDLRILALEDVSMRVHAEEQLRIAATAFETHGAMTVYDREQRILRVNQAFTDLTQYTREEAVGATSDFLRSGRHDAHFYRDRWRDIEEFGRWEGEMWARRKDGSEFPVWQAITAVHDGGHVTHYVANMIDITERVRAKREIERLAFYDPLTGLPNRRYLLDRLGAAVAASRRRNTTGALLFIDLDHFKHINDSMGHAIGDQVLTEVANRLRDLTRQEDVVSRMGGDEFIVMLSEIGQHEDVCRQHATAAAQKISVDLSRPYLLSGQEFHMTPTIGIALFPGQSDSPNEVLKEADSAMYRGKIEGRNTFRFYHASMAAAATERVQLENELRAALGLDQLELYFQPQIDLDIGVIGAEALIRWHHPTRGFIPPDKFIPIAEDTNLIHGIGEWVITRALTVMRGWLDDNVACVRHVSINVSARQFRAPDFVATLERRRAATGVAAHHVVLELTERTVIDDIEGTIQKINELRQLGFRFSIDDFGIGYSSLSYLRRLPLDQLKIDRSFVLDVVEDINAGIIAEIIISMGRQLGLETIAEGVETEAQRAFLAARGCRGFQGYLFCPPVTELEFRNYCDVHGRPPPRNSGGLLPSEVGADADHG